MAFVTAVVAKPLLETSTTRRRGNHHPNLWKDSFIQSLSSPYSASSYHERRETLRTEIKCMLNELGEATPNPTADNLLERFWTVDMVQRLGIGRYFQKETKLVLDYCYKYWKEGGIALDLNATALGFRTLRLNGYHATADVFNVFKDDEGQFFCPVASKKTHCELRSMLNLHRASELVFPGETVVKEANIFTTEYLKHALKEWEESKSGKNQLMMEVKYALKYPWRCNVPRLEARNYIKVFRQDNTSIMKKNGSFNQKVLELAILDFNILQCQHQSELKEVSRWWKDSGASQLDFFRHRHVEYYFWAASGLFEAEFGASRIAFSKLATMCTLLDDIYDTYGTLDELKPFTTALISRDISLADDLPDYMKVSFKFVLEILEDIEKEADYNPYMKKYAQNCFQDYILAYLKEAEWINTNYIPTFDEYIKNGFSSSALGVLTTYPFLLVDTTLCDKIFKELDLPSSKFQTLTRIIGRLLDDSIDLEEEEDRGEICSSIICFKRDNPESTYENALNYVNNLLESYMEDLTREYLKSYNFQYCYINFILNTIVKGFSLLYHFRDGFSFADKEIKNTINNILIEPIPMYVEV